MTASSVASVSTATAIVLLTGSVLLQHEQIKEVKQEVQSIKSILILTNERVKLSPADEKCLAKNIFYEAGVEDFHGKYAVAQVTLNRLRTGRWGDTVCKVVYARKQFSWTNDKKKRYKEPSGPLWESSKNIARAFVEEGIRVEPLQGSLMYHAEYVDPAWRDAKSFVAQIGQHLFYTKGRQAG